MSYRVRDDRRVFPSRSPISAAVHDYRSGTTRRFSSLLGSFGSEKPEKMEGGDAGVSEIFKAIKDGSKPGHHPVCYVQITIFVMKFCLHLLFKESHHETVL